MCICAVTSGADGGEVIADFGRQRLAWLREFLPFAQGIPLLGLSRLDDGSAAAAGFSGGLRRLTQTVARLTDREVVATIDGKTLRRSHERRKDQRAIQMVSAWAHSSQLSLGQFTLNLRRRDSSSLSVKRLKAALSDHFRAKVDLVCDYRSGALMKNSG